MDQLAEVQAGARLDPFSAASPPHRRKWMNTLTRLPENSDKGKDGNKQGGGLSGLSADGSTADGVT